MAKAVTKYVECGWGLAYTKEDYDLHVRNSPARAVVWEPIGDEYFTFAVQQCGGKFAQWRVANAKKPLKFVFDSASKREKQEIAKVFFAGANNVNQIRNGVEMWV